jgi:sugar lactone lactonase YvrE
MKILFRASALMLLLFASVASAQIGPWASGIIYTAAGDGYGGGLGFGGFSGDGGPATNAELYMPEGVTADGAGNLYIADSANYRIRKVDAATGIITTFAGNGIRGYSGDGGPAIDAELGLAEGLPGSTAIVADAAGNIYISDQSNNVIRKVDATTGIITTYAGSGSQEISGDGDQAIAAGIPAPAGIAMDASGNLYIAETYAYYQYQYDAPPIGAPPEYNVVRKVDAATGIITTVAGNGNPGTGGDGGPAASAELDGPFQVALDGAGNLYIEEIGHPRVRKVDAATGIITTVAGNGTFGYAGPGQPATSAEFIEPCGLAVDAAGDLYISDASNYTVWRVDAVASVIESYAGSYGFYLNLPLGDGGPAVLAQLDEPWGLSFDEQGNLYIADAGDNRIRVVGAEVNLVTTTTTLTASAVELSYGQPLTLTATVTTPGIATSIGTVSFIDGSDLLTVVALDGSGAATFTLTPPGGNNTFTAVYNGALYEKLSVSAPPIVVFVGLDATTTVLTASPNPAYWGNPVTFTATVSSTFVTPTGSVAFYDGATLLATETLSSSGVATYSTIALSVGSHNITADFLANANFYGSTSNLVVEVINPTDFSISISPGSQTVYTGVAASYTVTIVPGTGWVLPVALSCIQLPANTNCSFTPATAAGSAWSSTLVVHSAAPSPATTASVLSAKLRVTALAGLFLLILPSRIRRYRKGWTLLLLIFAVLATGAAITGCSAPGPLTGATPLGAQTITVTGIATNGVQSLTNTANVTLNVDSLF